MAAAAEASPATSHHIFGDGVFSIDVPAIFTRNAESNLFQLVAPNDLGAITATVYTKADNSLDQFCARRFSNVLNVYKAVFLPQVFDAPQASGRVQEFEGTWPGESAPTYYVVACVKVGDVFVSLSIVTARQNYASHRAQYEAMFRSIRPGS